MSLKFYRFFKRVYYNVVATLGASLDEFARDVRAILDAKLKNF